MRLKGKIGVQAFIQKLKSITGPLGFDALFIFIGWRVNDVANLLYTLYLGKTLDPLSFGALAPIFALVSFSVLPIAIVFQIAIKFISRLLATDNKPAYRALLFDLSLITLAGSLVIAALILFARDPVLERLRLNGIHYIFLVILLAVIGWWHSFYMAVYQGMRKFNAVSAYLLLVSILTVCSTYICVAVLKMNLSGALIGKVVPSVVLIAYLATIFRVIFSGERKRDKEETLLMRQMFIPTLVYLGCIYALYYAPALFIRNFAVNDSGGFGAVMSLGMFPSYFIASIVVAIFPLASAEHAAGKEVLTFFKKALYAGLLITFGFTVFYYFFADVIFTYWNKAFLPYSKDLWICALAMGMNGIIQIISSVEMARHRYGFLAFLVFPIIIMLGFMYYWRTILNCNLVMIALALTHSIIFLISMSVYRYDQSRAIVRQH